MKSFLQLKLFLKFNYFGIEFRRPLINTMYISILPVKRRHLPNMIFVNSFSQEHIWQNWKFTRKNVQISACLALKDANLGIQTPEFPKNLHNFTQSWNKHCLWCLWQISCCHLLFYQLCQKLVSPSWVRNILSNWIFLSPSSPLSWDKVQY